MVGMAAMRSGPARRSRAPWATSRRSSAARITSRARAATSSPVSVNLRLRLERSTSCAPSTRSSSARPEERVDCVTAQAAAARPKC